MITPEEVIKFFEDETDNVNDLSTMDKFSLLRIIASSVSEELEQKITEAIETWWNE
jgi:hypothetical protein